MQNMLRILRYVVLALAIMCEAIIASVAVWNQSLSPGIVSIFSIDVYLTCLSALGLVFTFTILFLELAGKDSLTGTVWFECSWVSTLFVLKLVGASVASAILVGQTCVPGSSSTDPCTSTCVLLSFSWILTLILLAYFLILISSILAVRGEHPGIWQELVRHFPRPGPKRMLSSEPSTPVLPHFTNVRRSPSIVAPIPRPFRAILAANDLSQWRSGLDSEYFQPPLRSVPQPPQRAHVSTNDITRPVLSLYPQFVQSTLQSPSEGQPSSVIVPVQHQRLAHRVPSPPPLAGWPRPDVLLQPVRSKRPKNLQISQLAHNTVSTNTSQRPSGPRSMPGFPEDEPASGS